MTRFVLLHYICDIKWLKTIFKLLTNCQKLQFLNEQIRKRKTPYLGFYNHSVAWVRSKISNSINYFENPAKRSWNLILDIKWRMIWDWIHLKWSYQIQGRMARRFMFKILRGMSVNYTLWSNVQCYSVDNKSWRVWFDSIAVQSLLTGFLFLTRTPPLWQCSFYAALNWYLQNCHSFLRGKFQ